MSFASELRFAAGSVADRALSFAVVSTCAGCDRDGTRLCRSCRVALDRSLRGGATEASPRGSPALAPLIQLEWCAPFTGIARRAINRLSDAGERHLSRPLGEAIAHRWRAVGGGGDVMVPVPAASDENQDRGYDDAVLLARVAGRRLRLPVIEALGWSGGGFEVLEPARVAGLSVVLVDDVVASGVRLAGCAAALLRAGARAVSAVTVASDRLTAPESIALS